MTLQIVWGSVYLGNGAACPALRPRTVLGDAESASVDRKCSTAPGLDGQPLFQGTFCVRRQPVSKATPCPALQRGPHQTASLRVPHSQSRPKFKGSSRSPKAEPTREWGGAVNSGGLASPPVVASGDPEPKGCPSDGQARTLVHAAPSPAFSEGSHPEPPTRGYLQLPRQGRLWK